MQFKPSNRSIILAVGLVTLALASIASAKDFEWRVPPLPVEAKVAVVSSFECLEGFRFTTETELSWPLCLGTLPATCSQTVFETFECRSGQLEMVHTWTSDPDCGYDADGSVCEEVFELEERMFVPLDPGPYMDPRLEGKLRR